MDVFGLLKQDSPGWPTGLSVLAVNDNEITVKTSIMRGKGIIYRGNAVLVVRPDQIRKRPQ